METYEFIEFVQSLEYEDEVLQAVRDYLREAVEQERYGRIVILARSEIADLVVDAIMEIEEPSLRLLGLFNLASNPNLSSGNQLRLIETGEPAVIQELALNTESEEVFEKALSRFCDDEEMVKFLEEMMYAREGRYFF
ncbi:hypothetical protein QYE77_08975 [Thermanaerothrix sp. 4228-RoL]|uniref:Uncharacterized protein n=1 Tax=Thermanaerothrix solaris TaxID=3058434 RepID=A0ABU3NQA4_9CHLR|nr:hypothetical protein [Thermanaerothrix sp. 4228-RoL]MDT8898398.1 hypothetical protein [Thermanaerothrix sp. 4228-RoL]